MSVPARARTALWGAAISVALLFVTWFAAFHIGFLERADRSILSGFASLQRPRLDSIATFVDSLCNPASFVFLAGSVILVAIYQRPRRSVPEASRAWSGDDVSVPGALAPAGVIVVLGLLLDGGDHSRPPARSDRLPGNASRVHGWGGGNRRAGSGDRPRDDDRAEAMSV
ncbi:MAG: hypothetical protein ACLPV4_18910 [Solirubrobacteraceae bacterium]